MQAVHRMRESQLYVGVCCAARVPAMSAQIRTAWDQKVIISFVFTFRELVKPRQSGIYTAQLHTPTVYCCCIFVYRLVVRCVRLSVCLYSPDEASPGGLARPLESIGRGSSKEGLSAFGAWRKGAI